MVVPKIEKKSLLLIPFYNSIARHRLPPLDGTLRYMGLMEYHIYGIINQKNGKIYIGQTKQGYRKRFIQHLTPSESCPLVRNAVKKYGREAFECELLDVVYSKEAANAAEKMWIKALGTYKPERGYNLLMGGVFGEFNDDVRRKMSIDRTGAKNNFYGKHHTEETKQRWREERKGKYALSKHPRAKSIKCVETGVVYSCVKAAQLATGINAHHIGQVANHKGRNKAGDYRWEWAEKS